MHLILCMYVCPPNDLWHTVAILPDSKRQSSSIVLLLNNWQDSSLYVKSHPAPLIEFQETTHNFSVLSFILNVYYTVPSTSLFCYFAFYYHYSGSCLLRVVMETSSIKQSSTALYSKSASIGGHIAYMVVA